MLLEKCDMSVKEWLNEQHKITESVIDTMITIGLQSARGLQSLHDNDVKKLGNYIIFMNICRLYILNIKQFGFRLSTDVLGYEMYC